MRVLVTGGAGYIGSHIVRRLVAGGHEPVVLDDLSEGHAAALPGGGRVTLVQGDMADPASLDKAMAGGRLDAAIHMAASCLVGESMRQPGRYYDNNVTRTLKLLQHLIERGTTRVVFSSTAAVYGEPGTGTAPITETQRCAPTNVYGETKLAIERALHWHARAGLLRAVSLRYFNAAGADPSGKIGEDHREETHLIPIVMAVALGRAREVTILGEDYPTPDGTCLRDYIHVSDLAAAHILALKAMESETSELRIYNLGAQSAVSVLELIEQARRVTGRPIPARAGARRPGDPPALLASSEKIRAELGWAPEHSSLETILRTAWNWHREHPGGYAG